MNKAHMDEHKLIENRFGLVTNKAVHFNVKKGLFAVTSQETLPLRHVTAVRLEISRHWIEGILLILMDFALLTVLIGVFFIAWGALLIWGSPTVVVNTAGGDLRPSVSWPWTQGEADAFVNTLRKELLKRE